MKNKHLTYTDRVLIEDLLNRGNAKLTTIAKSFGKDVSTISKEIKKHLLVTNKCNDSRLVKQCVKKLTCKISNLDCPKLKKHLMFVMDVKKPINAFLKKILLFFYI